ncbi:MAG: response regulator [Rikenellaceae bacterium]
MLKKIITTIAILSISSNSFATLLSIDRSSRASNYKLETIDESYGFLQNSVLDIQQDNMGYIWYATPNGVYKYDGYNFNIYYNEPNNITTIEGNFITNISSWFDGELCFSKSNMINVFDSEKRNFYRVNTTNGGGNYAIVDIVTDAQNPNIIWVLSEEQLLLLQISDDHKSIERVLEASNNRYNQILCDKAGYIWVLSDQSVVCCRYDTNDGIIKLFEQNIAEGSKITQGASAEVFLYSPGQITRIKPDSQYSNFESSEFTLEHRGEAVLLDDIHTLPNSDIVGVDWDQGIYNINLDNHQITHGAIVSDGQLNERFRYNISYIDSSSILWVGTRHGGLYKINLKRKEFNAIDNEGDLSYSNQITGDRDGNLYIGTHYSGIKHINIYNHRLSNKSLNSDLGISEGESIFAVDYYDGYLWYANTHGAIYRARCSNLGEVISRELVIEVATQGLGFFYRGESGRLYYALLSQIDSILPYKASENIEAIYYCDNSSGTAPKFKPISTICDTANSIGGVTSLLEDGRGALLVGSASNGLFRIQLKGGESAETINLPSDIAQNNIFSLYIDDRDRLYVGTFGGGLVIIENEGDIGSYKYFTRANGLANNAVYSIEDGMDGSLWISTDEGLSRFDTTDESFMNYDTTDGILSTNFRKWSSWRAPSGHLLFGGIKGVNYFVAEQIKDNTLLPEIVITDFRVGGKDREYEAYTYKVDSINSNIAKYESVKLAPYENDLRFEFAALHFENPVKHHYQYMLRGVDKEWHEATSNARSVTYSNLSHGRYDFLVRGTNSDGLWSEEYAALPITIEPYWWQEWYAKLMYILLIAMVIYMLYTYSAQRNLHKMDNQLNQAKLDFFTNISHEIKTPLTIISALLDHSDTQEGIAKKDIEIVRRNNKRMLALVTQLLDFRKVTQGHAPFHPTQGDIVPLMEEISQNFMSLAQKNGVEYSFNNQIPSRELLFEVDKIEKIVANLLSNAFKYTPQSGGVIELSLRGGLPEMLPNHISKKIKQESSFYTTIAVRDNGDGIAPEHIDKIFDRFYQAGKYDLSLKNRGVGVGLAYSKILAELHEGYLYVESTLGVGSTFYLILPQSLRGVTPIQEEVESEPRATVEFLLEPKQSTTNVAEVSLQEPSTQKELLIVEDNQEIREFLREVLSPIYKIHEAADGVEGLEVAERLIPDIIISDVMMPRMDGITLCHKLKTGEKTDHIPIILLTANSTIDHRVEGIRSGADSYIPKPFNLEHLKVRVEKLLEIRTVLKNKYMQQSGLVDLEQIDINSVDKEFLASVERVIEENLDDSEFTVERLEDLMKYSHMQLYRKIKSISGVSVVEFIRNYRLKRSVDMMRQGHTRINEIMYSVGFATPSYFSKSFKKRYGKSPVEFIEELHNR